MKYIKRVTLENFQSHKFSVIDFDEQLNVIVGPSDSGKSAIIRGIKWVLYNEPSGDYFIKEGATESSVTLEFNDGVKLQRYRSKSKNAYILTNRDGIEVKFEGFGSTIPEEIIQAIGIKKINLDSDESSSINIGEQLEGAFLLSEKGGTRASAIGRLVGVNIVDDALREALKDTRNLNISRKYLDENILNLQIEIDEYKYLEELKVKTNQINNMKNNIIQLSNRLEKSKTSFIKLNEISKEKKDLAELLNKFRNIQDTGLIISTIENRSLNHKQLYKYNENLKVVKDKLEDSKVILEHLKDVNKVSSIIDRSNDLISRREKSNKLLFSYKSINTEKIDLNYISNALIYTGKVDVNIDSINNQLKKYNQLMGLKDKIQGVTNGIKIGKDYLSKLHGLDKSDRNTMEIVEKVNLLRKYSNVYDKLLINNKESLSSQNNLAEIHKSIDEKLLLYQQLLKELEVCPLCLSSIDEESINHIIEHYVGGN